MSPADQSKQPADRLVDAGAVVGWSRSAYPGQQFYYPPHVPKSQRTLGEKFTGVTAFTATRLDARYELCGERLVPMTQHGVKTQEPPA
jgi:hypothetical protein